MKKGCLIAVVAVVGFFVLMTILGIVTAMFTSESGKIAEPKEPKSKSESEGQPKPMPKRDEPKPIAESETPTPKSKKPKSKVSAAQEVKPSAKPETPAVPTIFDQRQWTSADGLRTFVGKLTKMDDGQVTVEKDGEEITFLIAKLSDADKRFLGQGVTITTVDGTVHENGSVTHISADSILFKKASGSIPLPMESLPENLRNHFAYDPKIAEELWKARERQFVAMKEQEAVAASQKSAQDNLDTFMAVMEAAGVGNALISNVSTRGETITITVATGWHYQPKRVRQQSAQILWQTWAMISSRNNLDRARLSLRDAVGNEVGGSRLLAGSLIWVDE
jgi:hypothetical protein